MMEMTTLSEIRTAIVLAGGRGERLQSRIAPLPKPMAPVCGRPFLEYVLDLLVNTQVTQVILAVGFGAEIIRDHFGTCYRTLHLRYSLETTPLGTGGALALALKDEGPSPVLVLNGDSLLEIDYPAFFAWYGLNPCSVALVLREVSDISRYGSVSLSGERVIEFQEKGGNGIGLVNAGIYMVRPTLFSEYQFGEKFSFETGVLQGYCRDLRPRAFITKGYFIDIGIPEDYDRAQKEFLDFSAKRDHLPSINN